MFEPALGSVVIVRDPSEPPERRELVGFVTCVEAHQIVTVVCLPTRQALPVLLFPTLVRAWPVVAAPPGSAVWSWPDTSRPVGLHGDAENLATIERRFLELSQEPVRIVAGETHANTVTRISQLFGPEPGGRRDSPRESP